MAEKNYAKIDPSNNQVLSAVRVDSPTDGKRRAKLERITGWSEDNWVEFPEDEEEAVKHVRIGATYNRETGKFLRQKPYDSWTLNSEGTDWEPPVANVDNKPENHWDEENQVWRS
jgi:hypothetical protein|tara:strand:- start:647 stop:991 length:345 start_codon:yes stop_codon:yes gene_type:complete